MRRKKLMSDAESDAEMFKRHPELFGGVTFEAACEEMMRTIRAMTPDERAHLRYEIRKSSGIPPKTADGKPS